MISLPWEVVTRLRLEPVGPIKADVFGLRAVEAEYVEWWSGENSGTYYTAAHYHVAEPRRLKQFRDALGSLVDSPTGLRRPDKTPFYLMLCELQRGLNP